MFYKRTSEFMLRTFVLSSSINVGERSEAHKRDEPWRVSSPKEITNSAIPPPSGFRMLVFNSQKVFQVYSIFSLWDFEKSVKSVKKV